MLIENFEDFINRLDFNLIIQDPSKFLLDEFNIQLSNIQLIVILTIVVLFFAELTIRNINKKKQDTKEKTTLKKVEKSNEISSDVIRQKIDLAIAYMNMGKKGKSITLLKKLEKYQLTKKQLKQISQLRNRLT